MLKRPNLFRAKSRLNLKINDCERFRSFYTQVLLVFDFCMLLHSPRYQTYYFFLNFRKFEKSNNMTLKVQTHSILDRKKLALKGF